MYIMDPHPSYIAFMAVIPHSYADYLEQTLQEYDSVTQYIIGLETSTKTHQDNSGQHFHFFTDMSSKHYHTFSDRVFKKKFHLRGQARKGLPRQYGKIKDIHDLDKMAAYTVKDGNIRTNMNENTIQHYIDNSFKKEEESTLREKIYEYFDALTYDSNDSTSLLSLYQYKCWKDPTFLRIHLFRYFREYTDKIPNRNQINNIIIGYMLHHQKDLYSLEEVDAYIFQR